MNQDNDHTFFISAEHDVPDVYANTELYDILGCLRKRRLTYRVVVTTKLSNCMRAFFIEIENQNRSQSTASMQLLEQYENKSGVYLRLTASFLYRMPNGTHDQCLTEAYGPISIVMPLATFVLENL